MRQKRLRVEAGVVGLGLVFVTSVGSCGPGETAPGDGPLELDETSVRVVGSSDAIATVQDVDVLEDGSIWVLNSVEPFFVGFGSDCEIVEEYGARGGGPDEFDAPAGFVEGATGATAWVLDSRRNTLVEVPRPSSGRSEIPLHRDSVPLGSLQPGMGMMSSRVRSARVGEATLVARSFGSLQTGVWSFWSAIWGADLVAVEPSGPGARTIVSLADALDDPSDYLEQTNGFPPVPLWLRLWTVCPDGAIRVHDRMRNAVRGFSLDGAELDPSISHPLRSTKSPMRSSREQPSDSPQPKPLVALVAAYHRRILHRSCRDWSKPFRALPNDWHASSHGTWTCAVQRMGRCGCNRSI